MESALRVALHRPPLLLARGFFTRHPRPLRQALGTGTLPFVYVVARLATLLTSPLQEQHRVWRNSLTAALHLAVLTDLRIHTLGEGFEVRFLAHFRKANRVIRERPDAETQLTRPKKIKTNFKKPKKRPI